MPVIAYLFPGNGAAEANLGRDFYAKVPVVRDYMDRADKALLPLGLKVTKACFVSEPAELRRPSVAGPALMAVSCGVFAATARTRSKWLCSPPIPHVAAVAGPCSVTGSG